MSTFADDLRTIVTSALSSGGGNGLILDKTGEHHLMLRWINNMGEEEEVRICADGSVASVGCRRKSLLQAGEYDASETYSTTETAIEAVKNAIIQIRLAR